MNRKLITIIVTLIICFGSAFGQSQRTVVVKDPEGNPVTGARVTIGEASVPVATNEKGEFDLTIMVRTPVLIEADGFDSQILSITPATELTNVTLVKAPYQLSENDKVNVPFDVFKKRQIPGAYATFNSDEILKYNRAGSFSEAISGRVPGLWGTNIRQIGQALIVVDGIPRPASDFNMEQIESITVLKDLSSGILYGAQAQNGVILVTTKRGKPLKKSVTFTAQSGMNMPISYPEYLNAGDYMTLYNEARANDGLERKYGPDTISATRSGNNPIEYPDEDYYNSTYLEKISRYHEIVGSASGGNDVAQYYLNIGWARNNGLLKLGEGKNEHNDRLNMRGNVNYMLTDDIKITFDGLAVFNINSAPRYKTYGPPIQDFWYLSSNLRPDNTPLLIPVDILEDKALRGAAKLINGKYLLGGTSQYQTNIYGDLMVNGPRLTNSRLMEISTGLDFDLSSITPGLTASGKLSFDMYSTFYADILNSYAVYDPAFDHVADTIRWVKTGTDSKVDDQTLSDMSFYRRIGVYGMLNYKKSFGDHDLNINGLAYRDQYSTEGVLQQTKHLQFGLRVNYMYQNKYIVELTGVESGSVKLYETDPWAFSPAIGLGWVMSEEGFLSGNTLVNYLKARANFAIVNTDESLTNYYLGRNLYSTNSSNTFYYNQQSYNNSARMIANGNQNVGFEKMMNINLGFEALLLDNKLGVDAGYFYYKNYDVITRRSNQLPMFFVGLPYENFGEYQRQGAELGLTYNTMIGDLGLKVGGNIAYSVPKALVVDELNYEETYRRLTGRATDSYFGYVALGLFQDQDEIDDSPIQTFGIVQPGDIKYKDLNNDGYIDDNDMQAIGHGSRLGTGLHLNLNYKNFELFVLGNGNMGGDSYTNSSYYWIYGDRKYSDVVWDRWTPETAASATYPRLTTLSSSNNFRTSTFWQYDTDYFNLSTLQLTYTVPVKVAVFNEIRAYLRANDLFMISKNKENLQLNVGRAPQMRSVSLGLNVML